MRFTWVLLLALCSSVYGSDKVKSGFEFFDMIYTINLPKSMDRKEHIIAEFKRVGIKNYTIFVGTDQDSLEVKQMMQSEMVRKYPPCFRCEKIFCKCTNNVLIKSQVGNWLSFINLFKDIIKNDYQYVLITEDDVKFTDDARYVLDTLISNESFARNGIDPNKPILIRLFDFLPKIKKQDIQKIGFKDGKRLSNPCFIVNKHFAESFLRNLKVIDTASDEFIHIKILDLDHSIQSLAAYPRVAYELSTGPTATFYSTIHPKGIDAEDKIREKQHKKRIEYWEYLWDKLSLSSR